ncbi:MAG: hypothetical protein V3574_00260, partial [Candidatus Moraniibacteriota bacterium]
MTFYIFCDILKIRFSSTQPKRRTEVLKTENCYRVAATLLCFWQSGRKKALVSEVSHAADVSISSTRYWLNQFDCLSFVEVVRYV